MTSLMINDINYIYNDISDKYSYSSDINKFMKII